ncbi:hypothetical protein MAF45_09850, partial [Mesosutterella sp. OilRF-GAM-744-9]|nr:hypothetical protein [Mesosutterella sp. oilRF-744-WT-GAM-9]
ISAGAVRDWSIFIQNGFFDWVSRPNVGFRKELLQRAVCYWLKDAGRNASFAESRPRAWLLSLRTEFRPFSLFLLF